MDRKATLRSVASNQRLQSFSSPRMSRRNLSRVMSGLHLALDKKISSSMSVRDDQLHAMDISESLLDSTLFQTRSRKLEKKDFTREVRGSKDISDFLSRSGIILDLNEHSLEPIVDQLIHVMIREQVVNDEELKGEIFGDKERTLLADTIQARGYKWENHLDWDQSWLCATAAAPVLKSRYVGIARLKHQVNLGKNAEQVRFFILVLCPSDEKLTKSATEIGRTFSTLFSDVGLRHQLLVTKEIYDFKECIKKASEMFANIQVDAGHNPVSGLNAIREEEELVVEDLKWYHVGRGIKQDVLCRMLYYWDDFKDGIQGSGTLGKTTSATLFLYFAIFLPGLALGILNSYNTKGAISVQQVIIGQTIGGIAYSLLAGQPLVVVMTTPPLALIIKAIYFISADFGIDFLSFYAMVGIWNGFFLFLYSILNLSIMTKYLSNSTDEIFSIFITIAFFKDSGTNMLKSFKKNYLDSDCHLKYMSDYDEENTTLMEELQLHPLTGAVIPANNTELDDYVECNPEASFLSFILMLGTVWLGVTLFNFKKTPFLNKSKREVLSSYSLPICVIVFSVIGTVLFNNVEIDTFAYETKDNAFNLVDFSQLSILSIFGAMVPGFSISLLFFMDQNISAGLVNHPDNKLVKGNANHWDLLVIGLINTFLSIFGFPFMNAVLPHSPLHVKCLADTESEVTNGIIREIVVRVRETRVSTLVSNILIGLSLFIIGYLLPFIPTPVLDGLFLYLGVTGLYGNQFFERILLLITEQSAYPPNHYITRVPQRKIHSFTISQLVQLLILCVFGFTPWPYIKLIFPIILMTFLPIRFVIIPYFIKNQFLNVLDGH